MNTIASALKYNDTVLFTQGSMTVPAQVLQSQIVLSPDGKKYEEHLTLSYLDPNGGRSLMSQDEMDRAHRRVFGISELTDGGTRGFTRVELTPVTPADPTIETETTEPQIEPQAVA